MGKNGQDTNNKFTKNSAMATNHLKQSQTVLRYLNSPA